MTFNRIENNPLYPGLVKWDLAPQHLAEWELKQWHLTEQLINHYTLGLVKWDLVVQHSAEWHF